MEKTEQVAEARKWLLQGKTKRAVEIRLQYKGVAPGGARLAVVMAEQHNTQAKRIEEATLLAVELLDNEIKSPNLQVAMYCMVGWDIGNLAIHQACLRRGIDPKAV